MSVRKGAIKVPMDGLSFTEIRWHQTGGAALQEALSQMTWLLGWFKVLFCVVTACDKLRAELYNTAMIPALI